MHGHIIGGAMLPHAPQFFTLPDSEDRATVANVQRVAADIGSRLRALEPDVWIIVSNDHAQQFFHDCAPPFTFHVGDRVVGEFAGRAFDFSVASDLAFSLVRELYATGFDPAFTSTAVADYAMGIPLAHLGVTDEPVLPVFVNSYLPPQPPMERCYAFGRALSRALALAGVRAVIIASGGMSHFPGTERYSQPCLQWDEAALQPLKRGNLRSLLAYDEAELDDTGNIELRSWAIAAGALGERVPDVVQLDPSWHHNYASLGWYSPAPVGDQPLHYPRIKPSLIKLTQALQMLAHSADARQRFLADRVGYADEIGVPAAQTDMFVNLDAARLVAAGVHPLVPFLASMHIGRVETRGVDKDTPE